MTIVDMPPCALRTYQKRALPPLLILGQAVGWGYMMSQHVVGALGPDSDTILLV